MCILCVHYNANNAFVLLPRNVYLHYGMKRPIGGLSARLLISLLGQTLYEPGTSHEYYDLIDAKCSQQRATVISNKTRGRQLDGCLCYACVFLKRVNIKETGDKKIGNKCDKRDIDGSVAVI